jgi:hypothetical protein
MLRSFAMGVDVGRGLSARRHALGKCHPNPTSELGLELELELELEL